MAEHPIGSLMHAATDNIKAMVDVNVIVGDPVHTPDGDVILPISRVAFGFASGGSDFQVSKENKKVSHEEDKDHLAYINAGRPFAGGSGGGMYITPIAFLVVGKQGIHVVSLHNQTHLFEKVIDAAPGILDQISSLFHHQEHNERVNKE